VDNSHVKTGKLAGEPVLVMGKKLASISDALVI
jgi:hypothetical protein